MERPSFRITKTAINITGCVRLLLVVFGCLWLFEPAPGMQFWCTPHREVERNGTISFQNGTPPRSKFSSDSGALESLRLRVEVGEATKTSSNRLGFGGSQPRSLRKVPGRYRKVKEGNGRLFFTTPPLKVSPSPGPHPSFALSLFLAKLCSLRVLLLKIIPISVNLRLCGPVPRLCVYNRQIILSP
jgi:hypothetical protein